MKWRTIYMTNNEIEKYTHEMQKHKYLCKNCGRKVYIDRKKDKAECDWCHRYVFKTKKDEDIYRIKEKIKNGSNNS